MKFNPSFGVICESSVLHDKRLSAIDLRVYLHMKFRFQFFKMKGMDYFESYTTISDSIGVSKRSVSSSVDLLSELGLVKKDARKGGTYLFEIIG